MLWNLSVVRVRILGVSVSLIFGRLGHCISVKNETLQAIMVLQESGLSLSFLYGAPIRDW